MSEAQGNSVKKTACVTCHTKRIGAADMAGSSIVLDVIVGQMAL